MRNTFTTLATGVFALSPAVRYVAVNSEGTVESIARARANASGEESDRYEELLVNPILLELVRRRGNLDCGGAQFVLVRYGHFYQLVVPMHCGHASVAIDVGADPVAIAELCVAWLAQWASGAPAESFDI